MTELTEADWRKEVEGLERNHRRPPGGRTSRFSDNQDERMLYAQSLGAKWERLAEQWAKWFPNEPPVNPGMLKRRCFKVKKERREAANE